MKYRVLLAEDEELIGEMIRLNLEEEGYDLDWVLEGDKVRGAVLNGNYDLIVLDVMMPGKIGFDVARELRDLEIGTPILMLTARSGVLDKVTGLDSGADDYLTKPFDMSEFLARVRALIRRSLTGAELHSSRIIRVAGFTVNLDSLEAESNEGTVSLSEKEAHLTEYFVRHPGRTLLRADILDEVWGMDATPTERTVDNFILRLRRLFEESPDQPKHFLTIRSKGYRYEP